ncbi:MAG: hypothetical protein ACFFG0_01260 [Candidatus Thorarchaeota archaeon]
MEKAVLMGPFIGEFYWECGRFAPMLPYLRSRKYRKLNDIKYIILTRSERFDLYGKMADILVPLRINGDYQNLMPNCFRLNGYPIKEYYRIARKFKKKYSERFKIIEHIYPNIDKGRFCNKNQYHIKNMIFKYSPRDENYELINKNMPGIYDKPIVLLAPRFRKGFKRNWGRWEEFYDCLYKDKEITSKFNFVICGKEGEYIPDKKNRFPDMARIPVGVNSSRVGLLLVLMEKASFVCGSQSAIPNIGLLYKNEVLEFGCQKSLHTKTYNVTNTPITFIDDRKYKIGCNVLFNKMKKLLRKHEIKEK